MRSSQYESSSRPLFDFSDESIKQLASVNNLLRSQMHSNISEEQQLTSRFEVQLSSLSVGEKNSLIQNLQNMHHHSAKSTLPPTIPWLLETDLLYMKSSSRPLIAF